MRSHIEGAQQALLVGDAPKALDERNSTEVVLLGIIQGSACWRRGTAR